jgi:ABC-type Mn2+/Zn2+ transport system permease subunit
MKIIILIALCYLLCRFIKPIWKAFIVGIFSYILISFIIMTATVPPDAKLNITGSSFSYFAAGALGEFLVYFAIGLVIFLIFNKSKKADTDIIESSATNDTNENPPT